MQASSWIVRTRAKFQPSLRLFCFPYAGGGASIFRPWTDTSGILPAEVDICPVCLPGREIRLREPLFTSLPPLVETLSHALEPFMDVPFAFFGHSMGALISFELARYLRRIHHQGPAHLFISSHPAPQLPNSNTPFHDLPEPSLLDLLSHMGGTPEAILQHAELMKVILPILRADFELCETYVYTPEPPLDCPISAFGGEQDTMVSLPELLAWQIQTQRSFTLNLFPGDHFFLHSQQDRLLQTLFQELTHIMSTH
jgi:medium-chain acyl-[acyl-carrier-protein] hydrolase